MEEFFTYGVGVTPSDTVDIDGTDFYGLTCTTAGTCTIITKAGGTVTLTLAVGMMLKGIGFKRVKSTGTAALGISAYK